MNYNKENLKKLFDECMKVDTVLCQSGYDKEDGGFEIEITEEKAQPRVTIRDFEVATLEHPDNDFFTFEEVCKELDNGFAFRIMDNHGSILFDNYCTKPITDIFNIRGC